MSRWQVVRGWLEQFSYGQRLDAQRRGINLRWQGLLEKQKQTCVVEKEALGQRFALQIEEIEKIVNALLMREREDLEELARLRAVVPIPPPEPEVVGQMSREEVYDFLRLGISAEIPIKLKDAYFDLVTVESARKFYEWTKVWELNVVDGIRRIGERTDSDDFVWAFLGDLARNRAWAKIPWGEINYEQYAKPESHLATLAILSPTLQNPIKRLYHVEPQETPDRAFKPFPVLNIKKVLEVGWL